MTNIRIETREQLLYTLTEAAEVEHNLMCCYLYAAFSLKQDESEGLAPDEVETIEAWRRSIIHVAVEEMSHLALVSNLMIAIGGAPHFGRPNFPITPGYHPAGLQVRLAPFSPSTLQHFIFLERPAGSDEPDGEGFATAADYRRFLGEQNRLMPSGQDYETVGDLYHAVSTGLQAIAKRDGETELFVGARERQIGPDLVGLPGLATIGDLAGAMAAIDTIVLQGEGARTEEEAGHYQRFVAIRREYDALRLARPGFEPARMVAHNPVMRKPVTPGDRVWVSDPDAAAAMDYANALYGQMLRLLAQAFGRHSAEEKSVLLDAAINLMFAITPAAEHLTLNRANESDDCTAGMSFATLRPLTALPTGAGEWRVLQQRFGELAAVGQSLAKLGPRVAESHDAVRAVADKFALASAEFPIPEDGAFATPPDTSPRPSEPSSVTDEVERVEGADVSLMFDTSKCIHARHCVTGAPRTFLANVEGPWLHPDSTPADRLATIAARCPSGAIVLQRKDGREDESAPEVNLCHVRENGPYAMRGELRVDAVPIGFRATLCRCGRSKNKPYCDGSHENARFEATGEPATQSTDPVTPRGGPLDLRPQKDGPLVVAGSLEICSGTGRVIQRGASARLCRCGGSANKPFCDGTHARIGFKSD